MAVKVILIIFGGMLFLVSAAGYIFVKFRLKPQDPELDYYYHEFEDQHPEVARYNKWLNITLTTAAVATLLLVAALII